MFHERVTVAAPKLNMSWTLLGVRADDGMSRYTEIKEVEFKQNVHQHKMLKALLCCLVLSPQIVGATVDAPPTWKVSVHVPAVGWAVVNETKSKL